MQHRLIYNDLLITDAINLWKKFPQIAFNYSRNYFKKTKNPRQGVGFAQTPYLPEAPYVLAIWLSAWGLTALNSSTKTLVEALYAATSGRLLLLTGVERVAVRAHIQREVLTRGRTYLESGAARTVGGDRVVIRVNTLSHFEPREAICRHLIACQAPHTGLEND